MSVLVDTSALYALLDRDDPRHAAAAEQLRELRDPRSLVTHSYVLVETTALLQRRAGVSAVRRLVDLTSPMGVIWVDETIHKAAMAALLAAPRRRVSLVDRVSFELMRDRGISEAFAFDPDFVHEGFTTLPA